MAFVIYDKETTLFLRVLRNRYWQSCDNFKTEAQALAYLKRKATLAAKKGKEFDASKYGVAEKTRFHEQIEKTETKRNLLSGKEFEQPVNTPSCCDPSTETYHSM